MRTGRGFMAALALALAPALAQPCLAQAARGTDDGDTICLAVAHGWSGSFADQKSIRQQPVPESFSRRLEGGGCPAWQMIRESLINWHLAFGDEESTTAALAYLARQGAGGRSYRPKLSAQVKADRDLAEDYRFIAMEYARSANFFASPALLAKARHFAEPSLAVGIALRAPGDDGKTRPDFDDYSDRLWRELDLQLAVAIARIGGTAADFAAARAVFARNDDPGFDLAGEHAYRNGEDFCDIGDATYLTEWKEVCQNANFDRRAQSWWRYRAVFTLAAQAAGVEGLGKRDDRWDGETAIRLIEGRARDEGPGLPPMMFNTDSFALTEIRLALAEAELGKARRSLAAGGDPERMQAYYDAHHALDLAWLSTLYVQGADHPGWLRRIGKRYLEMSEFAEKAGAGEERDWPMHRRRLAWFRTVLPRLDAMAVGEATPLAPAAGS